MDNLLLVGNKDQKLAAFLAKMGYQLLVAEGAQSIPQILEKNLIDLVLINSSQEMDGPELCTFFRTHDVTKSVPIVFIAKSRLQIEEVREQSYQNIEYVDGNYSIGMLVSRIAVQLRLRKLRGAESTDASLGEVNAMLRDLNRHFTSQMEEAREIQKSLLPESLPQDDRYEVAAVYEPLEELGGDFYDVQKGTDGSLSIQIADATGHGLSAALLCTMTKLARSAAGKTKPDELLAEMNRLMTPVMPAGKFVTAGAIMYDPAAAVLHAARAGHPPALALRRKKPEVEQLVASGFAFGFDDNSPYNCRQCPLDVNDVAVLITDGISEAMNRDSKQYGLSRLAQALMATRPEDTAVQVLKAVQTDFHAFRDGRILKDDVTIIVLKRLA